MAEICILDNSNLELAGRVAAAISQRFPKTTQRLQISCSPTGEANHLPSKIGYVRVTLSYPEIQPVEYYGPFSSIEQPELIIGSLTAKLLTELTRAQSRLDCLKSDLQAHQPLAQGA